MASRSLRPFPHSLKVGTDITHIPRMLGLLKKNGSPERFHRFLGKLLTPREEAAFWTRWGTFDAVQSDEKRVRQLTIPRWAAKEAVVKANATWRHLTFSEIQILHSPGRSEVYAVVLDKPVVRPDHGDTHQNSSPAASPKYDDDCGGQITQVSISHDGDYATAVCIAASQSPPGDVGGEAEARGPEEK